MRPDLHTSEMYERVNWQRERARRERDGVVHDRKQTFLRRRTK